MKGKYDKYCMVKVRLLIGIISSLLVANSMSVYGQPFGGCEDSGLTTLLPGCSTWQYFGLSMAIVFIFWIIKPKYVSLKYWGLLLVIMLALFGGLPGLSNGAHLSIWDNPSIMFSYWRGYGLATLFGGFVGVVFLLVLERWLALRKAV